MRYCASKVLELRTPPQTTATRGDDDDSEEEDDDVDDHDDLVHAEVDTDGLNKYDRPRVMMSRIHDIYDP